MAEDTCGYATDTGPCENPAGEDGTCWIDSHTTDETTDDGDGWSILELREMDEQEARQTLPVAEYERWEKLADLEAGAEETREQWDREAEVVAGVTVHADKDALGTEVDLYGNTLLVHADSDDDALREAFESFEDTIDSHDYGGLESDMSDYEEGDLAALETEASEALGEALIDVYDAMLLRWNGTEWGDVTPVERHQILDAARQSWGLDAFLVGVFEVIMKLREDHEETAEAVKSFLGEGRGGHR